MHILIHVLFIFALTSFSLGQVVSETSGQCPQAVTEGGSCLRGKKDCGSDNECPLDYKCCATTCGRGCVKVELPPSPPHRGQCPQEMIQSACIQPQDLCGTDDSCPLNQKCCVTNCGRACVFAELPRNLPPKQGQCPPLRAGGPQFCNMIGDLSSCSANGGDAACPGNQKCCLQDCKSVCVDSYESPKEITKPGMCPPISLIGIIGPCVIGPENCVGDGACPGDEKCCPASGKCGSYCTPILVQDEGDDPSLVDDVVIDDDSLAPMDDVVIDDDSFATMDDVVVDDSFATMDDVVDDDSFATLDDVVIDDESLATIDDIVFDATVDNDVQAPTTKQAEAPIPVWAIALFVVFALIIVIVITVQIHLIKINRRSHI